MRVSLVTLGVADVARAARFYETLGMRRRARHIEGVAFFDAGGVVLALFGRAALAEDAKLANSPPGFGGVALAYNVADETSVDAALAAAVSAGGKLLKPAERASWGGYSGYFADLDGHPWEIAHNSSFPFDDRGNLVLPD